MFRIDPDGRAVQGRHRVLGAGAMRRAGLPGVYTRLSLYTNWVIETVTAQNNANP